MKIATAAYPLDWLESWSQYEDKLSDWVGTAAAAGADLLTFPEYGEMELASLAGTNVAGDVEQSICAVSERIAEADQLHQKLAAEHQVHILAASAPIYDPSLGPRPINRARLITAGGHVAAQDKQIMTRYERDEMDVVPGNGLQIFDTTLGRIGVLICYDSEFPLLGRALSEADVILAPSCTEALSGYWRVRIGSMARALENQCVTAMASLVGAAAWCPPDQGYRRTPRGQNSRRAPERPDRQGFRAVIPRHRRTGPVRPLRCRWRRPAPAVPMPSGPDRIRQPVPW